VKSTHLSDEAVAAFADGVLRGHARDRAARHVDSCPDCRSAVRSQREAVLALRAAPAPALPAGLFERLKELPAVTAVPSLPAHIAAEGSMLLASVLPAAALIPQAPVPASRRSAEDDDDHHDRAGLARLRRPARKGRLS
jgi:anti-sigma factor RsiW